MTVCLGSRAGSRCLYPGLPILSTGPTFVVGPFPPNFPYPYYVSIGLQGHVTDESVHPTPDLARTLVWSVHPTHDLAQSVPRKPDSAQQQNENDNDNILI